MTKYDKNVIFSSMFLAGDKINGKVIDACTGDSGGPCMRKIEGEWVLVGLVSWGNGCCKKHYPGVYTKVQIFCNWICRICNFDFCVDLK